MRRSMLPLLLTTVLVASPVAPASLAAPASTDGGWSRLAGPDRFGTAAATARAAFPDGADVVYLARADVPVDAVAAGSLDDGPLLLVRPDGPLPSATEQAIADLAPSTVVALGGPAAVSDDVLREAAEAGGDSRTTERIAGPDRHATAAAISQRAFPDGSELAYVAAGIPDALAAGVLTRGPVLLVPPDAAELPAVVRHELERLDVGVVLVLTGPARLDPAILQPLDDPNDPDGRVTIVDWHGPERIATSTRIAVNHFGTVEVPTVYVASAGSEVDALAAGSLSGGPILLAPGCGALPPVLVQALEVLDPAEVVGLGGPEAVCDDVLDQVAAHARAPFPEPPGVGTLSNATPAPAGHVEPYHGSLVTPLEWSRDGSRLLLTGTPPGRSSGFGPPPPESSGIGLYVHDVRGDTLVPLRAPDGWSVGSPELATLSADGSEVFVEATKETADHSGTETWLLALPVGAGEARKVHRGYVRATAGAAVVLGDEDATTRNDFTVLDTLTGTTWDPGLDRDEVSEVVPSPDAGALVHHGPRRGSVTVVRRDGTRRTVAEAAPATRCRVHSVFAHDVSDDAAYVIVAFSSGTPPNAPSDCPRGPSSEVRVLELATGRSAPLATFDGDPAGVSIHTPALSSDGSVVAFDASPAAPAVPTAEGGYTFGPAPDREPFDGAPAPQDGERSVVYRVDTAALLAGDPAYGGVSVGTEWEHGYAPVVAATGEHVAWKAMLDGRTLALPREVVLYRTR